jgi:hypothetical protein
MTIPDAPSDANTYGRHAGSWNAVGAGTAGVASWNTRTGAVTMTSADVTGSLGFTPYNATNPAGYQTAAQVTAALPVASSTTPLMDGAAAIGAGTTWARADHVHASDTSRLALTGGTMTGPLTTSGNLTIPVGSWLMAGANTAIISGDPSNNVLIGGGTAASIHTSIPMIIFSTLEVQGILQVDANGIRYNNYATNAVAFKWTGSALAMYIDNINNGTINTTPSDEALKINIEPSKEDSLATLQKITLISYDMPNRWIPAEPPAHYNVGFSAQQLRGLVPEAAHEDMHEGAALLSLDISPLVARLVGAVQQLAAQGAALEARIAALEGARH